MAEYSAEKTVNHAAIERILNNFPRQEGKIPFAIVKPTFTNPIESSHVSSQNESGLSDNSYWNETTIQFIDLPSSPIHVENSTPFNSPSHLPSSIHNISPIHDQIPTIPPILHPLPRPFNSPVHQQNPTSNTSPFALDVINQFSELNEYIRGDRWKQSFAKNYRGGWGYASPRTRMFVEKEWYLKGYNSNIRLCEVSSGMEPIEYGNLYTPERAQSFPTRNPYPKLVSINCDTSTPSPSSNSVSFNELIISPIFDGRTSPRTSPTIQRYHTPSSPRRVVRKLFTTTPTTYSPPTIPPSIKRKTGDVQSATCKRRRLNFVERRCYPNQHPAGVAGPSWCNCNRVVSPPTDTNCSPPRIPVQSTTMMTVSVETQTSQVPRTDRGFSPSRPLIYPEVPTAGQPPMWITTRSIAISRGSNDMVENGT